MKPQAGYRRGTRCLTPEAMAGAVSDMTCRLLGPNLPLPSRRLRDKILSLNGSAPTGKLWQVCRVRMPAMRLDGREKGAV